jgi:hypothetical protein
VQLCKKKVIVQCIAILLKTVDENRFAELSVSPVVCPMNENLEMVIFRVQQHSFLMVRSVQKRDFEQRKLEREQSRLVDKLFEQVLDQDLRATPPCPMES